jgi:hypothetical protein
MEDIDGCHILKEDNMKGKYLFLDIDDVLNHSEHGNDTYYD